MFVHQYRTRLVAVVREQEKSIKVLREVVNEQGVVLACGFSGLRFAFEGQSMNVEIGWLPDAQSTTGLKKATTSLLEFAKDPAGGPCLSLVNGRVSAAKRKASLFSTSSSASFPNGASLVKQHLSEAVGVAETLQSAMRAAEQAAKLAASKARAGYFVPCYFCVFLGARVFLCMWLTYLGTASSAEKVGAGI
jgi:hypothetical protein